MRPVRATSTAKASPGGPRTWVSAILTAALIATAAADAQEFPVQSSSSAPSLWSAGIGDVPPARPYPYGGSWPPQSYGGPQDGPYGQVLENPVRLANYPGARSQPLVDPRLIEEPKRGFDDPRNGFFQKLDFAGSWLPGEGISDFGLGEFELTGTFALPLFTRDAPLVITPAFGVHYLDGPLTPDMPPRAFDAYIEFRHLRKLSERWGMDVAIAPGWYSDFQTANNAAALRITGHALAAFKWTPTFTLIFGALYLDRMDVSVLPAGGIIWKPHDELRVHLIFPEPKISWRLCHDDVMQLWWYLAGEFGGDEWAIERASGVDDQATYRDLRLIMGLERKVIEAVGSRVELAYVFSRKIKYASATPDFPAKDTLMLRFGVTY